MYFMAPAYITEDQLKIAALVKKGDYVIPSSAMIHSFNLDRPQYIVTDIDHTPGHCENDISFKVRGLSGWFDASWFRWTGELPLNPQDPCFLADQPTIK